MKPQADQFPVRCDNGHFHLTAPGIISIRPGVRLRLESLRYLKECPECGASGLVESGDYTARAGLLKRVALAWELLRRGYL